MSNIVDDFYNNYEELLKEIEFSKNVSLRVWAHESFRRVLVLTMANYLENEVRAILKDFSKRKSGNDLVHSFLLNSMDRQYHTYFEWRGGNANKFFSLFGDCFKNNAVKDVNSREDLEEGIRAFLEIGQTRNILMHESLYIVDIGNKTAEEFYKSFQKSLIFIDYLKEKFR